MFVAESSPSNWFLHRVHAFSEKGHPVAARVLSCALAGPFSLSSTVFHAGCCVGKLPFSAVKIAVRCIPIAGKSWSQKFPEGLDACDVLVHAYKTAGFAISIFISPFVGGVSPTANLSLHVKCKLIKARAAESPKILPKEEPFTSYLQDPEPVAPDYVTPTTASEEQNSSAIQTEIKEEESTRNSYRRSAVLPPQNFVPVCENPPEIAQGISPSLGAIFCQLFPAFFGKSAACPKTDDKPAAATITAKIDWPKHILEYKLPLSTSKNNENSPVKTRNNELINNITKQVEELHEITKLSADLKDLPACYKKYRSLYALIRNIDLELRKEVGAPEPEATLSGSESIEIPIPLPPPPPGPVKPMISEVELDPTVQLVMKHAKISHELEYVRKELFDHLFGEDPPKNISEEDLEWTVKRFLFLLDERIHLLQDEKARNQKKPVRKAQSADNASILLKLPVAERNAIVELNKAIYSLENSQKLIDRAQQNLIRIDKRLNTKKLELNRAVEEYKIAYRNGLNAAIKEKIVRLDELHKEIAQEELAREKQRKLIDQLKMEYNSSVKLIQTQSSATSCVEPGHLINFGKKKIESLKQQGLKKVQISKEKRGLSPKQQPSQLSQNPFGLHPVKLRPVVKNVSYDDQYIELINQFYINKVEMIEIAYNRIWKNSGGIIALPEEIEALEKQAIEGKIENSAILEEKKELLRKAKEIQAWKEEIGKPAFHKRWESEAKQFALKKLKAIK